MAIKSKKPRSKPKQVARAPRREPVAVHTVPLPPLGTGRGGVRRRRLRDDVLRVAHQRPAQQDDAEAEAAAEAATKRQAAMVYKTAVDAFGTIGVINEGIVPPTCWKPSNR